MQCPRVLLQCPVLAKRSLERKSPTPGTTSLLLELSAVQTTIAMNDVASWSRPLALRLMTSLAPPASSVRAPRKTRRSISTAAALCKEESLAVFRQFLAFPLDLLL